MKHLFYLFALAFVCINAKTQETEPCSKWKFSVMTEAITNPFHAIKTPLHPGVIISYNLMYKTVRQHSHSIDANVAYYYHPLMSGNSIMIWPEYRYEKKFLKKFSWELAGGLGYKHNIADRKVYRYDENKFKKVTDFGSSQGFFDLGYGFGYELNSSFKICMDHRAVIAVPYGVLLPFSLHSMFSIGVQYKFQKSNQ